MENNPIVVVSAGIKKKDGKWCSTELKEDDDILGSPGGYERLLAGKELWKNDSRRQLIVCGGIGFDIPDYYEDKRPLISEIMERELLELSIPKKNILQENTGNTTYQILLALDKMFENSSVDGVDMVTSRYNVDRLKEMIKYTVSKGKFTNIKIKILSAEELLIESDDSKWENVIECEYEKEYLKNRIKMEQKGVIDLRSGVYKLV